MTVDGGRLADVVDPGQTFETLDNGHPNRPFSVTVWNSLVQTAGGNLIASRQLLQDLPDEWFESDGVD